MLCTSIQNHGLHVRFFAITGACFNALQEAITATNIQSIAHNCCLLKALKSRSQQTNFTAQRASYAGSYSQLCATLERHDFDGWKIA